MATKTASASLEARLKANPDSLSFSRVAEYFRTSGDIARAIDICVGGNEKHPGYVTGRIVLGRCYADLENFEDAVEAFTSVCELDRRNMVAMKMLADIFLRLGARDKAGDLYALLVAMDPWNETLSRLAAQTPGSRDADILAILGRGSSGEALEPSAAPKDAPQDAPKDMATDISMDIATSEQDDASIATLPGFSEELTPVDEAEAAAQSAVTQEVTRLDLGITEAIPEEKDEAVLETSENVVTEEALFEATTVTGNDITDRMAMLFGDKPETQATQAEEEKEVLLDDPVREPLAEATEEAVETVEVQPMDTIPDGNTISARIDELFSRDTLKMPAIKEVAPTDAPKDAPSFEKKDDSADDDIADTIMLNAGPGSAGEAEFEETMIMDALEVRDFLQKEPEPLQKTGAGSEESGSAGKESDLVSDAPQPFLEAAVPAELIVDEKDAEVPAAVFQEEQPAAAVATDSTVTGDDVVRLMTDFFEEGEDKAIAEAIAEVVGPETIDDFFEASDLVAEPLPLGKGPVETAAEVPPVEEKPSPVPEDATGRNTPSADYTVTGDDVVKRIDGYFSGKAAVPEIDFPELPAAGAANASLLEESDEEATIVESSAGDEDVPLPAIKELESAEEATVVAEGMVSGDDVVGRIDGMFGTQDAPEPLPEKAGESRDPEIDDTRVVDAGRPSETDVIEDTVAEGVGGLLSGADVEERLEEYFHDAADKTASKKSPLSAVRLPDEEAAGPGFPEGPGLQADLKADYEETIITSDEVDADSGEPVADSSPVADEEAIVETVGSMEETLDAKDSGHHEETVVQEKDNDRESTAVFTDFGETSVFDAPSPPPEVPLFTVENPRVFEEETIGSEIQPVALGPVEPDIPDHVLTPTLADIYLQQGQPKLALTIYLRLLEKKPDNEKLAARVKEIEKALAEGVPPASPVEQKPEAVTPRKKAAVKGGAHARQQRGEDTRPLAGVRLKKKPNLKWKKSKNV